MNWLRTLLIWLRPDPAPAPTPAPVVVGPFDAADLVRRHNDERRARNLRPLAASPELTLLAASRAAGAAARRASGVHLHDGFALVPGSSRTGENADDGATDAASVMVIWMGSTPHRENVLNPAYTAMGAGRSLSPDGVPYWFTVFTG